MSGLRGRPLGGRADAEVAADAGAWCAPAPRAYLLGLGADFAMARLAVTGDFGHERAERGTTATQPSRGSGVCQVCPHLRGKLDPPTFDLFCRFTFRLRRTGHTRLMHEKSLEDSLPQSDTRSRGYNCDVEVRQQGSNACAARLGSASAAAVAAAAADVPLAIRWLIWQWTAGEGPTRASGGRGEAQAPPPRDGGARIRVSARARAESARSARSASMAEREHASA